MNHRENSNNFDNFENQARPQWRYFRFPHAYYEREHSCRGQKGVSWKLDIYRNVLYAFAKYRRNIVFQFQLQENSLPIVDFVFENWRVESNFYREAFKLDQNTCLQKQIRYKTIKKMINLYFEQFINDLVTISRRFRIIF